MKVAVSACLLGEPCRYDGRAVPHAAALRLALLDGVEAVPVCPEVAGGLPTPRAASEIVADSGVPRVVDERGVDVTSSFEAGAASALETAREAGCSLAVLKARSPSCGSGFVHDGTFSGTLVPGYGIAARAFRTAGIRVIDEEQLRACAEASAARHPGHLPALLAADAAECPVLETERLVLRALTLDDVEDVFAYCRHPDIGPAAGWMPHRTVGDSRFFVEEIASAPHVFGLFERRAADAVGPCIGSVGLIADPQRRNVDCLMLGYALARPAWGRGYMTEAVREVLRYGFEELGLRLITCTHYPSNERSRRVIGKSGFVHEGTLHGLEIAPDGTPRDCESYYLTRKRWEELADTAGSRPSSA